MRADPVPHPPRENGEVAHGIGDSTDPETTEMPLPTSDPGFSGSMHALPRSGGFPGVGLRTGMVNPNISKDGLIALKLLDK